MKDMEGVVVKVEIVGDDAEIYGNVGDAETEEDAVMSQAEVIKMEYLTSNEDLGNDAEEVVQETNSLPRKRRTKLQPRRYTKAESKSANRKTSKQSKAKENVIGKPEPKANRRNIKSRLAKQKRSSESNKSTIKISKNSDKTRSTKRQQRKKRVKDTELFDGNATTKVRPKLDGSFADITDEQNNDIASMVVIVCSICEKKFTRKSDLMRHTRRVHHINERQNCVCKICDKVLKNETDLARHKNVHIKKSYLCDRCGKCFNQNAHLTTHRKTMHEEHSFKCEYEGCPKIFSNAANRMRHTNAVHLNLRRYPCDKCPHKFKTSGALRVHMYSRHTDVELKSKYSCNFCGKKFYSRAHMKQHKTIHSDIKPFACKEPGCDKRFRDRSNQQKHEKTHNEIKPYTCDECGEGFSRKLYLVTHQYKHTGTKMFQCSICTKSFTQKGNLTAHMNLHMDNRKVYSCTKCDRTFNHKSNFTKHMSNHDNQEIQPAKRKRRRRNQNLLSPKIESEEDTMAEDIEDFCEAGDKDKSEREDKGKTDDSSGTILLCSSSSSNNSVFVIKKCMIDETVQTTSEELDNEMIKMPAKRIDLIPVSSEESIVEDHGAVELEDSSEAVEIAQALDLSNIHLINSDGISDIAEESSNDIDVLDENDVEEKPIGNKIVKVYVTGDNSTHEFEADVLKEFFEKCNKQEIPETSDVKHEVENVTEVSGAVGTTDGYNEQESELEFEIENK